MLKFEPAELENELRQALVKLTDEISIDFGGEYLEHSFEVDAFEDEVFTIATELSLSLPRSDTSIDLSIHNLIELAEEVAGSNTSFDGLVYHSPVRTVVQVMTHDVRSMSFAEAVTNNRNIGAETSAKIRNNPISIGLRDFSVHYGVSVVIREYFYDKYNPPVGSGDIYIEVAHPHGSNKTEAMDSIHAYLFELHATLGLEYFEVSRSDGGLEYPEDEELGELARRSMTLRPLLMGQGLPSVLREFNRGYGHAIGEGALLSYAKCIEYVSATVVREKQYEDLRKRLLARGALNPDADFLDGLLTLFEENRVLARDTEALKLAVERCCDPLPMAPHAPKFLSHLANVTPQSSEQQRKAALHELAASISASRNQLAHAKANYKPTGKECPLAQMDALIACAKLAAEQCIRWYAARSPESRRG